MTEDSKTWHWSTTHGAGARHDESWLEVGNEFVGQIKTRHAIEIVDAMNRRAAPVNASMGEVGCDPVSHPLHFHLDRVDAWLAELWAAKSIDVHDCSGETRANQFGLLHDIREDVHRLRREVAAAPVNASREEEPNFAACCSSTDVSVCDCVNKNHIRVDYLPSRARPASTPRPSSELVAALRKLRSTAALLQQNSVGCAMNHYSNDFELLGLPGWLVDTQKDIDAAEAALRNHDAALTTEGQTAGVEVRALRAARAWLAGQPSRSACGFETLNELLESIDAALAGQGG